VEFALMFHIVLILEFSANLFNAAATVIPGQIDE
jgi:hypothetical protein